MTTTMSNIWVTQIKECCDKAVVFGKPSKSSSNTDSGAALAAATKPAVVAATSMKAPPKKEASKAGLKKVRYSSVDEKSYFMFEF